MESIKPKIVLRNYQAELLEKIKEQNAILFLPTGSGKTCIALWLIKHMSRQLKKPISEGGKRTYFLVNSVELVYQQSKYLQNLSNLQVTPISGELKVDTWNQEHWNHVQATFEVVVMTSQIYLNALCCGFLKLENANLIIFDECHHAVNNHPMREIMNRFQLDAGNCPKVLGLSATLLNANSKQTDFNRRLTELEKTFQAKILTSKNSEKIKEFFAKPEEIIKHFHKYSGDDEIRMKIENICLETIKFIKTIKLKDDEIAEFINSAKLENNENLMVSSDTLINTPGLNRSKLLTGALKDIQVHIEKFGLYFGYACVNLYIIQLYRFMYVSEEPRYITLILHIINVAQMIRKYLHSHISKNFRVESSIAMKRTSTPKLEYLFDILKNMKSSDKCLVFVERKMTAKTLHKIVQMCCKIEKEYSHIVTDFIVGSDSNPLRNTREGWYDKRIRKKIMNEFKYGSLNVLIATNILEEGVDVQNCNIVVMFDELKTYRSYVQSKGRARMKGSKYIILNDVEKKKFGNSLNEFRMIEKKLELVIDENDITKEFEGGENEISEFYITDAGARIKAENSVPIIYRYCSSLPHDLFTELVPYWWITETDDNGSKVGKLQLPINSAIRTIIVGPSCSTAKSAKQAVAFEAIKSLHKLGALDDHLLPSRVSFDLEDSSYWLPNWEKNNENTMKDIFNASIKVPKFLENCRPRANVTSFLHIIRIKTEYPQPNVHRRIYCHGLLSAADYEFGIITCNEIPELCEFPIYTDLGKIKVKIEPNSKEMKLNEEQIEDISKFHKFLFLNVLNVVQKCFMYDRNKNDYFIVPLKPKKNKSGEASLAWKVIREKIEIRNTHASNLERETDKYNEENYVGKVITPWYLEKKQHYIVTKVNTGLNLQSKMPEKDLTFAEYFKNKYGLVALRPIQPMMEVRPITNMLECIKPRPIASSEKQRRRTKKDLQTYLPPEFCIKQSFVSVFWYKSIILPSVLHRFYYLLLAEDLRQKFVDEGSIGSLRVASEDESNYFIEIVENIKEKNKDVENFKAYRKPRKSVTVESRTAEEEVLPKNIYHDSDNISLADIQNFAKYVEKPIFGSRESVARGSYLLEKLLPKEDMKFRINFVDPPELSTLKSYLKIKGPNQYQILQALTLKGASDSINLERLETLGDSFLKYAVSLAIFIRERKMNEGLLTVLKGHIIGNKNLFYCAKKLDIPTYMKALKFSVQNSWYPPGFSVPYFLKKSILDVAPPYSLKSVKIPYHEQFSGEISLETIDSIEKDLKEFLQNTESVDIEHEKAGLFYLDKQQLSHKSIADALEALIGVYLQTSGLKGAFDILHFFGILANVNFHELMAIIVPSPASYNNSVDTVEFLVPDFEKFEELIGYQFNDKAYILQAVTHPSCMTNTLTDCYQKLEFVGDAVLDFLITSYIYQYCGNLTPGQLTDLRSALVNNNTFGALAVRLGLHKFLLSHSKPLQDAIEAFLLYQEDKNYEIHGNELMKLVNDKDTTVCEEVDIPKALGDIFEAVAGAIFLDSKFNLKTVWRIYYNIMKEEIAKFSERIPINPVRALYEQNIKISFFPMNNTNNELRSDLTDNVKTRMKLCVILKKETKLFYGQGINSTSAKRAAAKLALKHLGYSNFVI